jgi:hypothetical protein
VPRILAQELQRRLPLVEIVEHPRRCEPDDGTASNVFDLVVAMGLGGEGNEEPPDSCPLRHVGATVAWWDLAIPGDADAERALTLLSLGAEVVYVGIRDEPSRSRLAAAGWKGTIHLVPDPLVLARELVPAAAVDRRLRFLRAMGWYPADERPVVLQLPPRSVVDPAALAAALDAARAEHGGAPLVLDTLECDARAVETFCALLRPPVYRLPPERSAEDLLAAIREASCWIGVSPAGAAMAVSCEVPFHLLRQQGAGESRPTSFVGLPPAREDGDLLAEHLPQLLAGGRPAGAAALRTELTARVGAQLDVLAALAQRQWEQRGSPATVAALAARLADAQRHQRLLRRAWLGSRDDVFALRLAVGEARAAHPEAHHLALRVSELETASALAALSRSRAEHERDLLLARLEEEQARRREMEREAELERRNAAALRERLDSYDRLLATRAVAGAASLQRLVARFRR